MKKYIKAEDKEHALYFKGPFWVVADSVNAIQTGKFVIMGEKYLVDYDGNYTDDITSKRPKTHKQLWKWILNEVNSNGKAFPESCTYYPRGRVEVYKGKAYIHLNSICNTPKVIDEITKEYGIGKLDIIIDLNDTYQGSHYDFELE